MLRSSRILIDPLMHVARSGHDTSRESGMVNEQGAYSAIGHSMTRFLAGATLLASSILLVIILEHDHRISSLIMGLHCAALVVITWRIFHDPRPRPGITPF